MQAVRPAVAALAWACSSPPAPAPAVALEPADPFSFVVLELFTSEGCSSCPLADARLNDVAAAYAGQRVFPLAWHVTTWDGLGWPDPFADPRYTDRQRAYAQALPARRYTPQLVVQGQEDFNGQIRSRIDDAMVHWIGDPGGVDVSLALTPEASALVGTAQVQGAPEGAVLQVVLLQSGLVVDVPAGENTGRTLHHDNVVRSWVTVGVDAPQVSLPVPDDVDLASASAVVLVQDPQTMAVLGAAVAR
ncbi:MAG: DUF1223 domain-containing protein [Myxococcota bacterium]